MARAFGAAAAVAATLAGSVAAGSGGAVLIGRTHARPADDNPCLSDASLRCPDLVMLAPSDLRLDRRTRPGRVLLRAASTIENVGRGPLDVRGRRTTGSTMTAEQAILDIHNRWHLFQTGARLDFKFVPGARYGDGSVGDFAYWKFRHAAAFQLWSIDSHRRVIRRVRTGPKLDYCLRDLIRTHPSRHSPHRAVYPACSQTAGLRRDRLGTSAGWSDEYPSGYPDQWIDVTHLRGTFAFVEIADPLDLIHESNELDNVSEVYVSLPSGRVRGSRVGVNAP